MMILFAALFCLSVDLWTSNVKVIIWWNLNFMQSSRTLCLWDIYAVGILLYLLYNKTTEVQYAVIYVILHQKFANTYTFL
jgi:hypothetical protein